MLFTADPYNYVTTEIVHFIKRLFSHEDQDGAYKRDQQLVARKLTELAFTEAPDVFEGLIRKPHFLSATALVLVNGLKVFSLEKDVYDREAVLLALGTLLVDVELHRQAYRLDTQDTALLDMAIMKHREVGLELFEDEMLEASGW